MFLLKLPSFQAEAIVIPQNQAFERHKCVCASAYWQVTSLSSNCPGVPFCLARNAEANCPLDFAVHLMCSFQVKTRQHDKRDFFFFFCIWADRGSVDGSCRLRILVGTWSTALRTCFPAIFFQLAKFQNALCFALFGRKKFLSCANSHNETGRGA